MRVSWLHSLGGKLFLLICGCLLVTVAAISWRNSAKFREILDLQVEDKVRQQAREGANGAESILEGWAGELTITMHSMAGAKLEDFQRSLQNFAGANREFVAVEVFKADDVGTDVASAYADGVGELRFEGSTPADVKAKLPGATRRWLKRLAARSKTGVFFVANLQPALGLPVVALAVPFKEGQGEGYWTVLTAWQTRLLEALPKSDRTTRSQLLHDDGTVFVAADPASAGKVYPGAAGIVKAVKTFGVPNGLRKAGGKDETRLEGYASVPRFGLIAVVASDATAAYLGVQRVVRSTALWSLVFLLGALMISYLAVSGVTRSLKALTATTQRIATGDFSVRLGGNGRDEVGVLSNAVGHMAGQIQVLLKSKVEAARQEKELETARLVQATLFPHGEIRDASLSVHGHCVPASECGGDWWGHFLTDDGLHCLLIADATGHGAAAALVTALAYSCCMTLAETFRDPKVHRRSVASLLHRLNSVLYHAGRGTTTMTLFAVLIDPVSGEARFASAGHNKPYLVYGDPADPRVVNGRRHQVLQARGGLLGLMDELDVQEKTVVMKPGDKLVLYTDGIYECMNGDGQPWGKRRFEKAIADLVDQPATSVRDGLVSRAFAHFDGRAADDDVTVVVLEMARSRQAPAAEADGADAEAAGDGEPARLAV